MATQVVFYVVRNYPMLFMVPAMTIMPGLITNAIGSLMVNLPIYCIRKGCSYLMKKNEKTEQYAQDNIQIFQFREDEDYFIIDHL